MNHSKGTETGKVFCLTSSKFGYNAKARYLLKTNGIILLKGSILSLQDDRKSQNPNKKLTGIGKRKRDDLFEQGLLIEKNGFYELQKDVEIDNPTLAFNVVAGFDRGCPQSWKAENDETLKSYKEKMGILK